MELFIQIRNGQPFEHPIMGDNFRQAFPHIDVNNLPPEFAKFVRVSKPLVEFFEVVDKLPTYEWVGNVVYDVWAIRQMTDAERAEKIQRVTAEVEHYLEHQITNVPLYIEATQNEELKQAWREYLDALNAWTMTDITKLNLPLTPKLGSDGRVLSGTAPGSAPNVIE